MCSSEDSESLLTQQLSSGFPKFYMHSGISFKEFRLSVSCDGSIAIDETYKAPLVNVAIIRLQFHTFHAPPFFLAHWWVCQSIQLPQSVMKLSIARSAGSSGRASIGVSSDWCLNRYNGQ